MMSLFPLLDHPGLVLASVGLSFLFLAVVFRPLEMAFPAKPGQKFIRPNWYLDLCFFLGQYLLWTGIVLGVVVYGGSYLRGLVSPSFQAAIASQPFWLQAIEVIFFTDLLIYWGHRLQHNNKFLWRFHSVHHTAEHLDWLAAHREHPLDTIYTVGLVNLVPFVMGFPMGTLLLLIAFRGIWAIYIHSNVRLPIGPLRVLIGAPELHHWHHDKNRHAGNYANLSPLMDVIFGTYVCPDHEPESFGIHEPTSKHYVGHMLNPLLPASLGQFGIDREPKPEGSIETLPKESIAQPAILASAQSDPQLPSDSSLKQESPQEESLTSI